MSARIPLQPFAPSNVSTSTKTEYKCTEVLEPALLFCYRKQRLYIQSGFLVARVFTQPCMQIISHQALRPLEAACDSFTQLALTEKFIERRVTAQGELKQVCLMSYFTLHFSPLMKLIRVINNQHQSLLTDHYPGSKRSETRVWRLSLLTYTHLFSV